MMCRSDTFSLPSYPHHPGRNPRPTEGDVIDIARQARSGRTLEDPAVKRAWGYGLFLIQQGFFWEAHEVLEPVWMLAPPNSRERHFLQAYIQLANACLKSEMQRAAAALRLIAIARGHLTEATASTGESDTILGVPIVARTGTVRQRRRGTQSRPNADQGCFDGSIN